MLLLLLLLLLLLIFTVYVHRKPKQQLSLIDSKEC